MSLKLCAVEGSAFFPTPTSMEKKKVFPAQKNINLTKIIFQQYGNMHVFIIYYINRCFIRPSSLREHTHRTVLLGNKKNRIKKKTFLENHHKSEAALGRREKAPLMILNILCSFQTLRVR